MPDLKFYGSRAEMDVFSHQISTSQATGAQVIVMKGERGPENYFTTVHFGWMIDYQLTGDNLTHFFIRWTSDGFQKTGCFNLLCPGFIQVSKVLTPSMVLPGQSVIKVSTFREPNSGNWFLTREDNGYDVIGYWPKEIFNNMADCSMVQMGGEAYSPLDEPSPPMGSGVCPGTTAGVAAKFMNVELIWGNGDPAKPFESRRMYFSYDKALSEYYQAGYARYIHSGYFFQYGGPGGWKGK